MNKWAGCGLALAIGWVAATQGEAVGVKNQRTSNTYGTLTGAVAAALSGDTLLLTTGTFSEVVFIGAKNLTLAGLYNSTYTVRIPGGTTRVQPAALAGSVFTISNASVTLDSLDISGGGPPLKVSRVYGGGICATHASTVAVNLCDVYGNSSSEMGGGIYASNSMLLLNGTSVYSNRASFTTTDTGQGGGVAVVYGSLHAMGTTLVHHNTAEDSGGGLYLQYSDAALNDTQVSFNTATNEGGGIVFGDHVDATLADCQIDNNQALSSGAMGGGIAALNFSNLTATALSVSANSAGYGGGIALGGGLLHATGTFQVVTLANNLARHGGGGFYVDSGAQLRLRGGLLIGNQGDSDDSNSGDGGAILASGQGTLELEAGVSDLFLLENSAWNGGGIAIDDESSAALVSTQAFAFSISGNTAMQYGGGIALPSDYAILNGLGAISISGNTASESGGGLLQHGGRVHLEGLPGAPFLISSNRTLSRGGGICAEQSALLQLVNVQIGAPGAGNMATNNGCSGGGIALLGASTLQGTNVAFIANSCTLYGAGLYVTNSSASLIGIPGDPAEEVLPPNRFTDNISTASGVSGGGGVYIANGTLTLHDALLSGNRARVGGGIYSGSASTSRVINCVLATNIASAAGGGGGAYASSTANAQYLHCTISRNAEGGFDFGAAAPLFLTNCIVQANAVTNLPPGATATHCLIEPAYPGVNNFTGDPLFMKPSSLDFRLTYGSAATNRGATLSRIARDAIGNARPASTAYDPGAYEYDWTILDSDSDTMPDDWEVGRGLDPRDANALDDDDTDTRVNRDEYIADTDPLDDTDYFRLDDIDIITDRAYIWAFTSGRRQYRLEYLDDLAGAWLPVPGLESFPGAGGDDNIPDPRPLQTNLNYRLQVWVP